MTVQRMRSKIWKTKLKNHNKIKFKLLRAISLAEGKEIRGGFTGDVISKTDYYLENNRNECLYANIFFEAISYNTNIGGICVRKYKKDLAIRDIWFQQYVRNNRHSWHEHPDADIALIYYLELDRPEHSTEFKDEYTHERFFCNVAEGDIILFPARYLHRSPNITSDTRKTVIVSNCNLIDFNHES